MEEQAERLAEYCRDRVGDALPGVGYHTPDGHDVVYIREDVSRVYPADRLERFLEVSRDINASLERLDEMGRPEASLHELEGGFIIQFHRGEGRVIFLAIDADVGRQLSRFIDDCVAQLD